MITIALVNPEIPPNTGNIARLCAATGANLHIVGRANFDLSNTALKRAGLDYWHLVSVSQFPDIDAYTNACDVDRTFILTTHASRPYTKMTYPENTCLIFGNETSGLPPAIHTKFEHNRLTIPMVNPGQGVRSLNLANSVAIVMYEIIRQQALF